MCSSSIINTSDNKGVGLDALPSEVWAIILANLKTARDRQICTLACPLFNYLIGPERMLWGFELILPLILPRLDIKSALNCRLVCRDWENAFNKFIENCPKNRPYDAVEHHQHPLQNTKEGNPLWNLVKPVNLRSTGSLQDFHEQMQASPQCRVIGGSFIVGCRDIDDDEEGEGEYWRDFYYLSKSFGFQIFSLKLHDRWTTGFSNLDLQYMTVCMILRNCSNLRKLHLDFYRRSENGWDDQDDARMDSFVPLVFGLPDMPQLETLVLRNSIWTPLKLALLDKYGEQLRWLKCTLFPSFPDTVLRKMKSITELAVRINKMDPHPMMTSDAVLGKLLVIPSRQLKNLVVQMGEQDMDGSELSFSLTTMLTICEKFSLRILRMGGAIDLQLGDSENPVQLKRRIPALKCLEFFDTAGSQSFNFLQCFPALEQLSLRGSYHVPPQPTSGYFSVIFGHRQRQQQQQPRRPVFRQTVPETLNLRENLYKSMDDKKIMYRSPVWKEMRHLKRIDFNFYWINYFNQSPTKESRGQKTFTRKEFWEMTGF